MRLTFQIESFGLDFSRSMVNNLRDTDPAFSQNVRVSTPTAISRRPVGADSHMATDYDAPRKQDEDLKEDSIEELQSRRSDQQSGSVDEDEAAAAESFELPGADLSNEELSVVVLPAQEDEFTCGSCFLVRHRSQLAEERDGVKFCFECMG